MLHVDHTGTTKFLLMGIHISTKIFNKPSWKNKLSIYKKNYKGTLINNKIITYYS